MAISEFFTADDEFDVIDLMSDDDVSYCGKPISAIIEYNQQSVTIQDSFGTTPEIIITCLKKDVPNIKEGALFKHKNKRLLADAPLKDNGIHVVWALTYA